MPHFNRKKLLIACQSRIADLYHDIDYESVIVDDGSREDEKLSTYLNLRVESLPTHDGLRNPAHAINRAIELAQSEIVCLTNPEIFHLDPVAFEALALLDPNDDASYFVAPVVHLDEEYTDELIRDNVAPVIWGPQGFKIDPFCVGESKSYRDHASVRWSSHEEFDPRPYHNCVFFTKALWKRLGGFDEKFMDGLGWEDEDWMRRVQNGCDVRWLHGVVAHLYHGELYRGEEEERLAKINRAYFQEKHNERLPAN
jgi:glycosyltransferase involved in cell wall biosynthesis